MHEGEVIAILQPGVDRLAREGLALPGMARFGALQHIPHLLDQGVVLEKITALPQHNLIDKVGHGRQVFEPFFRNPSVAAREKIGNPPADRRRCPRRSGDRLYPASTAIRLQAGLRVPRGC
jgi:hypothetical protein